MSGQRDHILFAHRLEQKVKSTQEDTKRAVYEFNKQTAASAPPPETLDDPPPPPYTASETTTVCQHI